MKIFLFITSFFLACNGFGQVQDILKGYVRAVADSTAIISASVYFDGSTIGTITNESGYFSIENSTATTNPLVISSLGYETLILDPNLKDQNTIFYLTESIEQLEEVLLETDPWSRSKKLAEFKREFLGRTKNAERCTISNEEVLQLQYSRSRQKLTVEASAPLVIVNKTLGYKIRYDLNTFYVSYDSGSSGLTFPSMTYFAGTSFFQPLKKQVSRRIKQNRNKAYLGSLLHFMRALATKSLRENGFRIFHESFEVPPYRFFEIQRDKELVHVVFTTNEINILFEKKQQSVFHTKSDFYIDAWGNHSPPDAVINGGVMGEKRVAELVPINYQVKR